MRIDLHIHTNCSDGVLSPIEIINEAKEKKINTISITDHDTLNAYTNELLEYAKNNNISIIPGVEISTKINKCGIHVLGYNIDVNNKELNKKLEELRNSRHNYLFKVSKKLNELGYIVRTEELDKIDSVTKAHIAQDIINNKSNKELLIKEFKSIPSKGNFIETIMNEGCAAYIKKESITPKEAVDLIHKAGGKAVLAHPVAYTYEDGLTTNDIKKIITDMDADGIEAYYIYIDKNNNKHNDISKWAKFAKDNNLFVTIGSDFHKKDNIHPEIGLVEDNINYPPEEIKKFFSNN